MISFTMKFDKPWVAKRSHHLRQTAKISERHSWQVLGVVSIFLEAFGEVRVGEADAFLKRLSYLIYQ